MPDADEIDLDASAMDQERAHCVTLVSSFKYKISSELVNFIDRSPTPTFSLNISEYILALWKSSLVKHNDRMIHKKKIWILSHRWPMKCTVYNSDLLYYLAFFHPKCIVDINTINALAVTKNDWP